MIDGIVANLLKQTIGKFIKPIPSSQIDIKLLNKTAEICDIVYI